VAQQSRGHRSAPKIYVFDQQVGRDDSLAPGRLSNNRRVITDPTKKG